LISPSPRSRREGIATLEAGLQESQSESMTRISTLQARLTASERQEEVLVRRNEASEAEIERLREDARKRSATVQELEKRVMLLKTTNIRP
jgi:cell division protein FtsB